MRPGLAPGPVTGALMAREELAECSAQPEGLGTQRGGYNGLSSLSVSPSDHFTTSVKTV